MTNITPFPGGKYTPQNSSGKVEETNAIIQRVQTMVGSDLLLLDTIPFESPEEAAEAFQIVTSCKEWKDIPLDTKMGKSRDGKYIHFEYLGSWKKVSFSEIKLRLL